MRDFLCSFKISLLLHFYAVISAIASWRPSVLGTTSVIIWPDETFSKWIRLRSSPIVGNLTFKCMEIINKLYLNQQIVSELWQFSAMMWRFLSQKNRQWETWYFTSVWPNFVRLATYCSNQVRQAFEEVQAVSRIALPKHWESSVSDKVASVRKTPSSPSFWPPLLRSVFLFVSPKSCLSGQFLIQWLREQQIEQA